MLGAVVRDDSRGVPVLEVWESASHVRTIAMQAIATRAELWGISDLVEVAEAIIADQDNPVAVNPYADVYKLLEHREKAREAEAARVRAREQDKLSTPDPRSVGLASALAAYRAVHVPVAPGEECAMDRCRRAVREAKRLPVEPVKKPGATSRLSPSPVSRHEAPALAPVGPPTFEEDQQDRRAKLSAVLSQASWLVDTERRRFLHSLTGNTNNPLGDVDEDNSDAVPDTPVEALLHKYGGDDAA